MRATLIEYRALGVAAHRRELDFDVARCICVLSKAAARVQRCAFTDTHNAKTPIGVAKCQSPSRTMNALVSEGEPIRVRAWLCVLCFWPTMIGLLSAGARGGS